MSIKSIKVCYFKSRIKKSGLMDWKEKLDKVSWNERIGGKGGTDTLINDICYQH